MIKKETGEFLYRYYRKRTASFLASLYKASITCNDKDIHRARVDVKKVFALFHLFEIALPGRFRREEHDQLFQEIFDHSGRIREVQVNISAIDQYGLNDPGILFFRKFLLREEKKLTLAFLEGIKVFDEKSVYKSEKEIKKISGLISHKKLIAKIEKFIRKSAGKIKKLQAKPTDSGNVHKIRQNLKSMGATVALFLVLKPEEKQEILLQNITHTEILIGQWHDKEILLDSLKKNGNYPELLELRHLVQEECKAMLQQIKPEVERVLSSAYFRDANRDKEISIFTQEF